MSSGNAGANAPEQSPEAAAVEQIGDIVGRWAALLVHMGAIEIMVVLAPLSLELTATSEPDCVQSRSLDSAGHWVMARLPLDSLPAVPDGYAGMGDVDMG